MSQPTCAQGWSELLLALPEFVLTDARIDEYDELVADIQLPRDVQACIRCGVIDLAPAARQSPPHRAPSAPLPAGRAGSRAQAAARLRGGCGTCVERTLSIAQGSVWSRAAGRAVVAMSEANIPIDTIRKSFGIGWNTVMRAVLAAAELVAQVRPTRVGSTRRS